MTIPNTPSPNPGGQNRDLVREALKNWIDAQRIQGLGHVFASMEPTLNFEEYPTGNDYACLACIDMPDDFEMRAAYTGPDNPGGKQIHYMIDLYVFHQGFDSDHWRESQRDYDRIIDALKSCFRASGRDLGRPDVILTAGEYPASSTITSKHDPVVNSEGVAVRNGVISFQVSQYLTGFVPEEQ